MGLTVVQLVPALDVGGVERGTVEVARALVQRGHRAVVIAAGGRLAGELAEAGAEHLAWPIGRKSPLTLALVPRLRRLLREQRVDILHARSRLPAWVGRLALRGLPVRGRPRFVTTVHGPYTVNAYGAVMTRADRIIAISGYIRDYVLANYPGVPPGRIEVIHRGVDPAAFPRGYQPAAAWRERFAREHPGIAGRFLVTLPGRITHWKGPEAFLELIGRLKARGLPVHGLLAGGASRSRRRLLAGLHRRARALGLAGDVSFLGPRDDLKEIMAVSDVVVSLADVPEAFGRTTLEALCLGTPVVGFDHGGTREILQAIFPGGLCPPGDLEAVAERIAGIRAHPPVLAPEHPFTLARMLDRTLALYEALAAGGASR